MQKLKLNVLEEMFRNNLTNKEINFILHIAKYQDDRGCIEGIYYKDVCEATHMSSQKFYDSMRSLEEKGIIAVTKNDYTDWDITICNNDFSYYTQEDYEEGRVSPYINVNHALFSNEKFLNLKAGAKMMAIDLYRIIVTSKEVSQKNTYIVGVSRLYEKYKKLLHMELRAIQNYMHDLKEIFGVYVRAGLFYISLNAHYKAKKQKKETEAYNEHLIETSCRRNRIKWYDAKDKKDTAKLLSQYRLPLKTAYAQEPTLTIQNIIQESLEIINGQQANIHKWRRELQPKLVHKLLREKLVMLGLLLA